MKLNVTITFTTDIDPSVYAEGDETPDEEAVLELVQTDLKEGDYPLWDEDLTIKVMKVTE